MEIILALVGLAIAIGALSTLFSPLRNIKTLPCEEMKALHLIIAVAASSILILLSASICRAACAKTERLFVVERNKNGNTVHYDVCIGNDDYPSDTEPVVAYWILENGEREELNKLERDFAYGIAEYKKLGRDSVKIILVSMKQRFITIKRIGGNYRASTLINGKESVLERVYVKSHELMTGLPRVEFVDLYGRTKDKGLPVSERIGRP